ncbi:MAG TPA: hypothetical protein VHT02_00030, partial [Methylocella sp.]|nr:hypothetical protein [Methylocella sp.]
MPLTPKQKAKIKELEEISELVGVDFWNVKDSSDDNSVKNVLLDMAKDRIVRADVVFSYVLIDELLSDLICQHFFGNSKTSLQLW